MKKGFTIVELLMVIVLIGLLSLLVIPNVNRLINKSTQTLSSTQIKSVEDSASNFITDYYDYVNSYDVFTVKLKMLKDLSYVKTDIKNVSTGKYFSDDSLITYTKDGENYKASFYGVDSDTISNNVEYVDHIVLLKGANIFVSNNIMDTSNVVLMSESGKIYKYSDYSIQAVAVDTENASVKIVTYNMTLMENSKQYNFSIIRKESIDASATGPQFTITTSTNTDNSELTMKIVPESVELASIPYSFDNGVTWQTSDSKTITTSFNDIIRIKDSNGNVGLLNYNISKLTVNANGGVWNSLSSNSYFWLLKNEEKSINDPIKIGYNFQDWSISGDSTINGTTLKMGSTDTIITANWSIGSYTLTVDANGGTWSGTTPQNIDYNGTVTIAAPTRTNYTFNGWSVSGTGSSINGTTFTMGTANTTLTANWTISTYTLTVNANGGSWSGTTPQTVAIGGTSSIAIPTRSGYIFTGWTLSGTGSSINGTTFTMGTDNATLTANWLAFSSMYTYTGTSTLIDDGNSNFRLKFLTSGTLTLSRSISLDIFLVGGGGGGGSGAGGGGGGGYTTNVMNFTATGAYSIVIGGGGSGGTSDGNGGTGGTSTGFGYSASGGSGGIGWNGGSGMGGGAGGSGGGSGRNSGVGGAGGIDGGNGAAAQSAGGVGQGTTTREFAELAGVIYGSGGGGGGNTAGGAGNNGSSNGGASANAASATANTGGGGGGGGCYASYSGGAGGSGIVVIRNHR